MDLEKITYIDDIIESGKTELHSLKNIYDTLLVRDESSGIRYYRIPFNDFFLKYREELSGIITYYSLDERAYYKPKSVSLELYDTTELWIALLRVNNMKNISEFCIPTIKVYDKDQLFSLMDIFFQREGKSLC